MCVCIVHIYWTALAKHQPLPHQPYPQVENLSSGKFIAAVLTIGLVSESFKGGSASPLILLNGVYIGRYSVLSDSRRIFVLCVLVWRTRDIAEVAMLCDLDEKVSVILERRGRSVGRHALMTAQDISIMVQIFESTNVPDCVFVSLCLSHDR